MKCKIRNSLALLLTLFCVVSADGQKSKDFEVQNVCGDPGMESNGWRPVVGKIVEITSGRRFVIEHTGKKRTVDLAALDTTQDETLAKVFLIRKALHRQVKVWVTPSRSDESHITGQVWLRGKDLNRIMVEKGLARVIEPEPYSISNYVTCVYQQLEQKAKNNKIGIWAK